jgi:hypothetical protein
MDDAAFDRVTRSLNRFLSRREALGMLAGVGLAALPAMGSAADAKHRNHRRRHGRGPSKTCTTFRQACVSDQECCGNKKFTSCDVTSSSPETICCFQLGVPSCTSDADCCGAKTICLDHFCAVG